MYLTAEAVLRSIEVLRKRVHPFVGITFFACKKARLPVGESEDVSIDSLTATHMDLHHRLDRRSSRYFQPFNGGSNYWLSERYPSTGLQTVNTQTFGSVFLHPRGKAAWGFQTNYVAQIRAVLTERNLRSRMPVDALAVWHCKNEDLGSVATYRELVEFFCEQYDITDRERKELLSDWAMGELIDDMDAFSPEPLEMTSVLRALPPPPDAEREAGRSIKSLILTDVGPSKSMRLEFGQRLTMITGDNGLGKSFLLESAWWAATGVWADQEAYPSLTDNRSFPAIEYELTSASGQPSRFKASFDRQRFTWNRPSSAMTVEALAVFSRADGSFAINDPLKNLIPRGSVVRGSLTATDLWNGREQLIEGLLRDWVRWQSSSDKKAFDQLSAVLRRLSPDDLGVLVPGKPIRLPGEPRDVPTITHRYGTIPVTHASSGVRRVLSLAYLIIWLWQEHELAAEQLGRKPLRRILVIVDELEAHLHPKWQRIVLPALMRVGDLLSGDLALQMIAATHSPMVLASMEEVFDPREDLLFHLFGDGPTVRLDEVAFEKYGDATGWLTSPLFGMRQARSQKAEAAIEEAKALQLDDQASESAVRDVSNKLMMHLSSDDKFWSRWLYFAEQHGVDL